MTTSAIEALSIKAKETKRILLSEEATKMALVVPLLYILGYDITDPLEVVPEMNCDLIKSKGEKIDYCIKIKGRDSILIECKHWNENLCSHTTQLARYFPASDARIAILTNGIQYSIFTDTKKTNLMDKTPFYTLDIENMSTEDIDMLTMLSKDNFNEYQIASKAKDIMDYTQISETLSKELSDPSIEFIRFIYRKATNSNGSISGKKLGHYRELTQRAICSLMENNDTSYRQDHLHNVELDSILSKIINVVTNGVLDSNYHIRHFKTYSTVSYKLSYMWFVRIYYKGWDKCYISFLNPLECKGEVNKTKITQLEDIEKLKDQMQLSIKAVKKWIQSHNKSL